MHHKESALSEIQELYTSRMLDNLGSLRRKAKVTVVELTQTLGLHPMSYTNILAGRTAMSWRNYLALVFYFDCNHKTHDMLHRLGIYPDRFVELINQSEEET